MAYAIRKAVPEDEHRIRALFVEMLQTIYHTADVMGYEEGYLDKYWNNREDRIYVAEENDTVIAFLSVEVYREPKEYIYLDDLSVTEPCRDKGIGTELIRTAESYAEAIGIPVIIFHVEKSNNSAFRLYKRLGYTIYQEDGSRYLMIKNRESQSINCMV